MTRMPGETTVRLSHRDWAAIIGVVVVVVIWLTGWLGSLSERLSVVETHLRIKGAHIEPAGFEAPPAAGTITQAGRKP